MWLLVHFFTSVCLGLIFKAWIRVSTFHLESCAVCNACLVAQSCLTLVTSQAVVRQASLSMGFSRQEYWSGLPFPSPGELPNPGIKPRSPALQADSLPTELQGKPHRKLQFSSVAQSCPTLCDPMNCSTPGHALHHHLPESTQTHVH